MSDTAAYGTDDRTSYGSERVRPSRRISTETKSSYKTTELFIYLAAVVGVLVAAAVTDTSDFGTQEAWLYVTLLTIGYLVSRGLAKSGSRDFYDDNPEARRTT